MEMRSRMFRSAGAQFLLDVIFYKYFRDAVALEIAAEQQDICSHTLIKNSKSYGVAEYFNLVFSQLPMII